MKILIVIDMQNDFIYGALKSEDGIKIIDKIKARIALYRENNMPIIFTKDVHDKDYFQSAQSKAIPIIHCQSGSGGEEIIDGLLYEDSIIIEKNSFSSTKLIKAIELYNAGDIEEIELVGVCTDICVITNAILIKGHYPEISVVVNSSCCAGSTHEKHECAIKAMENCKITII